LLRAEWRWGLTLSQSDLNGRVIAALELSGLRPSLIGLSDRAPLQVTIDADGQVQHLRVYVRNITHGGHGRTGGEFRIQLTGDPPLVDDTACTWLLGYYAPLDVFVSFEPTLHTDHGYSPSIQISIESLRRAAEHGKYTFYRRRKGGSELVVAVRADQLGKLAIRAVPGMSPADAIWSGGGVESSRAAEVAMAESATVDQLSQADSVINIRPGVGIFALFPHMNYRPWFALGEFVDNSLSSYEARRARLLDAEGRDFQFRVVIEIDGSDNGFIRVWDNAGGIATADYARAFVTAEPPPPDESGLSEFGIGMKSASCWFARRWRVRSSALGESIERTVEFDVPRIVRDGIEDLNLVVEPSLEGEHFTEVRLWDLYKPPQTRTVQKMREHLASIYRDFIRTGDLRLVFDGEDLAFEQPKVLVAPRWDQDGGQRVKWTKEIDFRLPSGERVRGFAALRETGSTKFAGFALFRHRRLVVGSGDETYRPADVFGGSNSFRFQRLFGELHLDDLEISHTKDGFIWGDKEHVFLAHLKKELDSEPMPLLSQAERYRSRRTEPIVQHAAVRALEGTAVALQGTGAAAEQQSSAEPAGPPPVESETVGSVVASRTLDLTVRGVSWHIVIEITSDLADTDWLTVSDKPSPPGSPQGPRTLGIRMGLSSPFMRRFATGSGEDIEALLRIGAGLVLAETTAREAGVKQATTVRRNLNDLLAGPLARG
jgi:hypothetical protein